MRRSVMLWGGFLILVGGLLLVDNLGLFRFRLASLIWPLLVVAAGVWLLLIYSSKRMPIEAEDVAVALEGANKARIHLRYGAGRLQIRGDAAPGQLLQGSLAGGVRSQLRRKDGEVELDLWSPREDFWRFAWPGRWSGGLEGVLRINPLIALELRLETGACEGDFDLSDLKLARLTLHTGASATRMILPRNAGHTQVEIKSGASSVEIQVPQGVGARIRAQGGLAEIGVDRSRFAGSRGSYQSSDYETATHRVDIVAETGVGSIKIS